MQGVYDGASKPVLQWNDLGHKLLRLHESMSEKFPILATWKHVGGTANHARNRENR